MRIFSLALLLLIPTTLSAEGPRQMPDPFLGVYDHYQVDASRPAQTDLRDCHLFEVISFGRGLDDLKSKIRMSCHYLSRIGPGGSDFDRATRDALLAFEEGARKQMQMVDEALRVGDVEPPSGSLAIRTGWWADEFAQDRLIETHALDLIMEQAFSSP